MQRQWQQATGVTVFLSGEYGRTDALAGATRRGTLAGGIAYAPSLGLKASTRAEWRRDRGAIERRQILWTDHAESRINADLVALGDFRYSLTRDLIAHRDEARFQEHGVGVAYRPLSSDRYSHLSMPIVKTAFGSPRDCDQAIGPALSPNPGCQVTPPSLERYIR